MLNIYPFFKKFLNVDRIFGESAECLGGNNAGNHNRQNDCVVIGQLKEHQYIC